MVGRKNKQKKIPVKSNNPNMVNVSMSEPSVKAVIDEAVAVINDILNVGNGASYCSELDYEGRISAITVPHNNGQYGFHIVMHNVSEFQSCANRYPKARLNSANYEMFRVYDAFAEKYRRYYDYSHNGYVYKTINSVAPSGGEKTLNTLLFEQVKLRCPAANIMCESYIKDKKFCY